MPENLASISERSDVHGSDRAVDAGNSGIDIKTFRCSWLGSSRPRQKSSHRSLAARDSFLSRNLVASGYFGGMNFLHHACSNVLRLADMSLVLGMYLVDIHSFGSVRSRIPSAFCWTSLSELRGKTKFMAG